jgi:hypothetical protein
MPRRAARETARQPLSGENGVLRPHNRQQEDVTFGIGSRSTLAEKGREPAAPIGRRGLLPTPPDVEALVERWKAMDPLTPEQRKTLRDRLTLRRHFSDVEVAFRRTPQGIEVVAAGLDEIAEFRRTGTREPREAVVYGVG